MHFGDQDPDLRIISKPVLYVDRSFPTDNLQPGLKADQVQWLRPSFLCYSPEFIVGGTKRFDVIQGQLGDCWLMAAAAACAEYDTLLDKVVPPNQTFDNNDDDNPYDGTFKFNFFQYGEWIEVVVDDKLPTLNGQLLCARSDVPNEFCSALMEKAYAKLHGGYRNLEGGYCSDALTDLTGGIVERMKLRSPLFPWIHESATKVEPILLLAMAREKLITAGLWGRPFDVREGLLKNGLATGHAYTISNVEQVIYRGKTVTLIRVRNPWGSDFEWNGAWGDGSITWSQLNEEDMIRVNHPKKHDGDFWISIADFVKNFDDISICSLTSDSHVDSSMRVWNVLQLFGKWEYDISAGGGLPCRSFSCPVIVCPRILKRYAMNPQFAINVDDPNADSDTMIDIVIELSQKYGRRRNMTFHKIAFDLYKLPSYVRLPVYASFFAVNQKVAYASYDKCRTVTARFEVTCGKYLIVPFCKNYGEEAEFVIRTFQERDD